jgi:hypothetical protein
MRSSLAVEFTVNVLHLPTLGSPHRRAPGCGGATAEVRVGVSGSHDDLRVPQFPESVAAGLLADDGFARDM